ncbi:MAG: hypothetical protein OHK005_18110 [Candidatus Methylacidiphilales bacterium]
MVGVSEVAADIGVREFRLAEGSVGAFAMGGDVEALAGRVVEISGEFAFLVRVQSVHGVVAGEAENLRSGGKNSALRKGKGNEIAMSLGLAAG